MEEIKAKPVHITSEMVRDGIYLLAKGRPGVYTRLDGCTSGCVNVELLDDGTKRPSCIVGSYLASVVGVQNVPLNGTAGVTVKEMEHQGLITITPEALYMLKVAQHLQDTLKVEWSTIEDVIGLLKYAAMSLHHELEASGESE